MPASTTSVVEMPCSIYNPTVYEVGPGHAYHHHPECTRCSRLTPRSRLAGSSLPGAVDHSNPRYNGRGAYYENLIMYSPVKLQGVGPGGVYPDGTPVQGSIIDGIAFGGDTTPGDGLADKNQQPDLGWFPGYQRWPGDLRAGLCRTRPPDPTRPASSVQSSRPPSTALKSAVATSRDFRATSMPSLAVSPDLSRQSR